MNWLRAALVAGLFFCSMNAYAQVDMAPLGANGGSGGSGGSGSITPGTTPIVDGTNTRVLFDDNGVVGESAGLTFTKGTGNLASTLYNGNTFTTGTYTLTGAAGKTLTFSNTLTLAGTDSSTLNIGGGGTLGSNAFTSTAYLPLTGGTLTGNLTSTPGTANTENLTLNLGTITANTKAINITGTLNNAAVTFDAPLFMNITNTASNAASLLMDLQVGSTSRARLDIGGLLTVGGGAKSLTNGRGINFVNPSGGALLPSGIYADAGGNIYIDFTNSGVKFSNGGVITMPSNGSVNLTNTVNDPTATVDVTLARMGSAATLGLNDSTTASTLQVYGTSDVNSGTPTNYKRISLTTNATTGAGIFDLQCGGASAGNCTSWQFNVAGANKLDYAVTTAAVWTFAAPIVTNATDASASSGSGSLQVVGGASIAKRFWIPAITASAGLQTAVLCQSSGGEMIADSVACLASSERAKNIFGPSNLGLDTVMALNTIDYQYKDTGNANFDNAPNHRMVRSGFRAEDAARIDRRLVALDADGQVRTVVQDTLVATLWKAVQQQQVQIEELRRKLH